MSVNARQPPRRNWRLPPRPFPTNPKNLFRMKAPCKRGFQHLSARAVNSATRSARSPAYAEDHPVHMRLRQSIRSTIVCPHHLTFLSCPCQHRQRLRLGRCQHDCLPILRRHNAVTLQFIRAAAHRLVSHPRRWQVRSFAGHCPVAKCRRTNSPCIIAHRVRCRCWHRLTVAVVADLARPPVRHRCRQYLLAACRSRSSAALRWSNLSICASIASMSASIR